MCHWSTNHLRPKWRMPKTMMGVCHFGWPWLANASWRDGSHLLPYIGRTDIFMDMMRHHGMHGKASMHHGSFIRTSDGIMAHSMVMHHGSFKTSDGITRSDENELCLRCMMLWDRNASQLVQNKWCITVPWHGNASQLVQNRWCITVPWHDMHDSSFWWERVMASQPTAW